MTNIKKTSSDNRIDLNDLIKVDKIVLNNIYDQKAVLYVLNRKNKLRLTMDDVVFRSFGPDKAVLCPRNKDKYRGYKVVYYKQAKNTGYIIWLIISVIILFLTISVLLPVGLVGESDTALSWHKAGQIILFSCAPIGGISFLSIMVSILCWRSEVSIGKLSTVESKAEIKQKEKKTS